MKQAFNQIQNFLQRNGSPEAGGFYYDGYYITLDRMGDMTTFLNIHRDVYDRGKSLVDVSIEDGQVQIQKVSGLPSTPQTRRMRYNGPEQTLDALIDMVEGERMNENQSTMRLSERKLKRIIREETQKAMNEVSMSSEFRTIGNFMEDVSRKYNSVRPIGEKTMGGETVYEFEMNGAIFQIKPA